MCRAIAYEVQVMCRDPEVSRIVSGDRLEVGVALLGKRNQTHHRPVETDQTGLGANPNLSLIVLED
jgi:hypothetical protein